MSKVLAFYAETGSAGLMHSFVRGLMGFSFSFFPQGFTQVLKNRRGALLTLMALFEV